MRLLVFKANQLGDNVVFLPVARQWIAQLGAENVFVMTSPTAADLYRGLIPDRNLWIEPTAKVLGAWKNPARLGRLHFRLRGIAPDAAWFPFDQGNVPRLLARIAGVPLRAGAPNPALATNGFLNRRFEADPSANVAESEWRAAAAFSRELGLPAWPDSPPRPGLDHLTGPTDPEPSRVFIHAGASHAVKRWPIERHVALANRLVRRGPVTWASQGDPSEDRLSSRIERLAPGSLAGLAKAIAACGLFIGNNSGPLHLAAAAGVATVCLPGPAPVQWDAGWDRWRHLALRTPGLDCQPCATVRRGVTTCANRETPSACLQFWTVEAVETLALKHWRRCLDLHTTPVPA